KLAAEQGHAKSQYQLGRAYDKGDGVKEDDALAFEWYSKAAQQGNAKAQYQLGRCYKKGEGCTKDANAAFQWFEKSAAQGNADAQLALGKCYLKGKGVAEDAAKAKDLFLQAVNNPDGGDKIYKDIKKEASEGDADAKKILNMVKK
ncbi:MAG: sel1 repeat family protein, partial [Bacteroidales bacterium]|nr:sel1 repeat family protein [Bacteroidales bacterium]